jgi:hypothetical protein
MAKAAAAQEFQKPLAEQPVKPRSMSWHWRVLGYNPGGRGNSAVVLEYGSMIIVGEEVA